MKVIYNPNIDGNHYFKTIDIDDVEKISFTEDKTVIIDCKNYRKELYIEQLVEIVEGE